MFLNIQFEMTWDSEVEQHPKIDTYMYRNDSI